MISEQLICKVNRKEVSAHILGKIALLYNIVFIGNPISWVTQNSSIHVLNCSGEKECQLLSILPTQQTFIFQERYLAKYQGEI